MDDLIDKLKCELKVATEKYKDQKRQTEQEKNQESFRRRIEGEMEIEKMDMNRKMYEIRVKFVQCEEGVAIIKLQRLKVTKYEGTTLGWFQFWNQFENEIVEADINPVSKFSYLKELLMPNIRKDY